MKITKSSIVWICVLAVVLVAGCDNFVIPAEFAVAPVTRDGLFREDMTFNNGEWTVTYRADGTYEDTSMRFENDGEDLDEDGITGEGWVQRYGNRGTYVYDPSTMTMTVNQTAYYERSEGEWKSNEEGSSGTNVRTTFISSTQMLDVYFPVDGEENTWRFSDEWTYTNTDDGGTQSVDVWEYSRTYVLGTSPGATFSGVRMQTYTPPGSTTAESRGKWTDIGTIDGTYPADASFEAGNTVTFRYTRTDQLEQEYDWETETLGDEVSVSGGEEDKRDATFHHFGDFIVGVNSIAAARRVDF